MINIYNYLKKLLFIGIISIFSFQQAEASFLRFIPQTLTQPDGSTIKCFASGDEYFNWLHDANGYTIIQGSDGYYYFATKNIEKITASKYRVDKISPETVELTPWTVISNDEYQLRRKSLYKFGKNDVKTPTTGTINNIVIYIRFADDNELILPPAFYDSLFNSTLPEAVSLKTYYDNVSYGKLTINTLFYPQPIGTTISTYVDANKRSYFKKYDMANNPTGYKTDEERATREQNMLANAVNFVSSSIPSTLNVDGDNDGKVDNVCFIVRGTAEGWSDLLWPHMWSLYLTSPTINGKTVYTYNFQLELALNGSGVGVLCHEMFHSLGAPDLYHYTTAMQSLQPAYYWDIMEQDNNPPQTMCSHMKIKYGKWITNPQVLSTPGRYTLNSIHSPVNNCFKINSPNSTGEYFMVEYRKPKFKYENIYGSGLLVWRVNPSYKGNANYDGATVYDELYVFRPEGNVKNNGLPALALLNKKYGRNVINDYATTTSFLTYGDKGGLVISNVVENPADNTISFDLYGGAVTATPNAALQYITAPSFSDTKCLTNSEKLTVLIKNNSTLPITSGLNLEYKINNNAKVTETYAGDAIAAGASVSYTFTTPLDLSTPGIHNIKANAVLGNDVNKENDTAYTTVVSGKLNYSSDNSQKLTNAYTDLASTGTVISTANNDDANSNAIDIGFTFKYNCKEFTQFILNTNGFIKLGSTPPTKANFFFDGPDTTSGGPLNGKLIDDVNIISAFNHDLIATANTEYRVFTSGTTGNKICTIQFKNLTEKSSVIPVQYSNMNFQIKLYETTNEIEFVYGAWTPTTNTSTYKSSFVGIKGSSNSNSQITLVNKGSAMKWEEAIISNQLYVVDASFNFGNPSARPAPVTGTTYKFTPSLFAYTKDATGIGGASATLNGISNTDLKDMKVEFEYGKDLTYGTVVSAYTSNAVSAASLKNILITKYINGLSPLTTYHFRIKTTYTATSTIVYGNDVTFTTADASVTAISDVEDTKMQLFPNPSDGNFRIRFADGAQKNVVVSIYNSLGAEVYSKVIGDTQQEIEVKASKLSSGIYSVKISTNEFNITKKLVVK